MSEEINWEKMKMTELEKQLEELKRQILQMQKNLLILERERAKGEVEFIQKGKSSYMLKKEDVDFIKAQLGDTQELLKIVLKKYADIDAAKLDKKIILYGAGNYGNQWIRQVKSLGFDVFCVVDSDEEKIGKYLDGTKIVSLNDVVRKRVDAIWLVSVLSPKYQQEITDKLKKKGYSQITYSVWELIEAIRQSLIKSQRIDKEVQNGVFEKTINSTVRK